MRLQRMGHDSATEQQQYPNKVVKAIIGRAKLFLVKQKEKVVRWMCEVGWTEGQNRVAGCQPSSHTGSFRPLLSWDAQRLCVHLGTSKHDLQIANPLLCALALMRPLCQEFPLIKVWEELQTSQLPGAFECLTDWLPFLSAQLMCDRSDCPRMQLQTPSHLHSVVIS